MESMQIRHASPKIYPRHHARTTSRSGPFLKTQSAYPTAVFECAVSHESRDKLLEDAEAKHFNSKYID